MSQKKKNLGYVKGGRKSGVKAFDPYYVPPTVHNNDKIGEMMAKAFADDIPPTKKKK